jgi:hypothetical protein
MNLLDALSSEEFEVDVGPLVPAPLLRRRLLGMSEVRAVSKALSGQTLTDEDIGIHVSRLVREFQPGKRFEHDLALAALAVALETRATKFAQDFLETLSGFRLVEMPMSPRVAAECQAHRELQVPKIQVRNVVLGKPPQGCSLTVNGSLAGVLRAVRESAQPVPTVCSLEL